MADDFIIYCPKCGSRNLTYTVSVTSCRDCDWSDEKLVAKIKRKVKRKKK